MIVEGILERLFNGTNSGVACSRCQLRFVIDGELVQKGLVKAIGEVFD